MRQIAHKHDFGLGESDYIDIIAKKSASLFSSCCYLGATLSGASEKCAEAMRDYGLYTGIAFQITDDLLDVVGDESRTGKTTGSDVSNNKLTLPLIHLLSTVDKEQKKRIKVMLDGDIKSSDELPGLLTRHGSFEYTRKTSKHFIDKAVALLDVLDDSEAKESLVNLAGFVGDRLS